MQKKQTKKKDIKKSKTSVKSQKKKKSVKKNNKLKIVKKSIKNTSKKKKIDKSTIKGKTPLKTKNKAVKQQNKKIIKENNILEFEEIQYYNESDEEITTKSKYYDLYNLKIETLKNGKIKYICKIESKCVNCNSKKHIYLKEVDNQQEVMWFFRSSTAAKKLYKKAKISTKIKL